MFLVILGYYEVLNTNKEKYNRFPIPLSELQQNTACEQFDEWK